MKLNKVNITHQEFIGILSNMLLSKGYTMYMNIVPVVYDRFLEGFNIYDYDREGKVSCSSIDLNVCVKIFREYYENIGYNMSHMEFYFEDGILSYAAHIVSKNFYMKVLKDRRY